MKLSAADCVMKVPHDASVSPATMAGTGASSVSSTPSADSATDSRMVRRALRRGIQRPASGVTTTPTR